MKKLLKIGIPVVLIVAVIGAVAASRNRAAAGPSQYFTAAITHGPLKKVINATGVVQTSLTAPVGSQVSGQVEELYADYNSVVKRGQLLAKLDTRNLEAQVANVRASVAASQARVRSAEAELITHAANVQNSQANLTASRVARDNAKLQFDRANELSQRGVASKNDYDTAKANYDSAIARYDQAEASLNQVQAQKASTDAAIEQAKAGLQQVTADLSRAEINLGYANIYSPVDGVVISRSVDVGQTLAASNVTPILFTIATDLTRMQVSASVDEADIGSISEEAEVTFKVDAYPNDVFTGKITEIRLSPQTVQNVVTYSVILSIKNPDMKLKPGMTANITVTVDEKDNVTKVPNAALRYNPPNTPVERAVPTAPSEDTEKAPATRTRESGNGVALAPGQKWDPADKIRFVAPKRTAQRPGTLWVLGPDNKPQARKVVLGISDGASTEIVSGDMHDTDLVIIADSTQVGAAQGQGGLFGGQRGR